MTEWQNAWLCKSTVLLITAFFLILTPVTVALTGNIVPAIVVFPLGTLGFYYFTSFGIPIIIISVFQFFIYAAVLKRANAKQQFRVALAAIVLFHFLSASGMLGLLLASQLNLRI